VEKNSCGRSTVFAASWYAPTATRNGSFESWPSARRSIAAKTLRGYATRYASLACYTIQSIERRSPNLGRYLKTHESKSDEDIRQLFAYRRSILWVSSLPNVRSAAAGSTQQAIVHTDSSLPNVGSAAAKSTQQAIVRMDSSRPNVENAGVGTMQQVIAHTDSSLPNVGSAAAKSTQQAIVRMDSSRPNVRSAAAKSTQQAIVRTSSWYSKPINSDCDIDALMKTLSLRCVAHCDTRHQEVKIDTNRT